MRSWVNSVSSVRPHGRLVRDRKTLELMAPQQPGSGGYEPDRQDQGERPLEESVWIGQKRSQDDRKSFDRESCEAGRQPDPAGWYDMRVTPRSHEQDERRDAGERKTGLRHGPVKQAGDDGVGILREGPGGDQEQARSHDHGRAGAPGLAAPDCEPEADAENHDQSAGHDQEAEVEKARV